MRFEKRVLDSKKLSLKISFRFARSRADFRYFAPRLGLAAPAGSRAAAAVRCPDRFLFGLVRFFALALRVSRLAFVDFPYRGCAWLRDLPDAFCDLEFASLRLRFSIGKTF